LVGGPINEYNRCITENAEKSWCPTQVDSTGYKVEGKWANCEDICPSDPSIPKPKQLATVDAVDKPTCTKDSPCDLGEGVCSSND